MASAKVVKVGGGGGQDSRDAGGHRKILKLGTPESLDFHHSIYEDYKVS